MERIAYNVGPMLHGANTSSIRTRKEPTIAEIAE